MQLEMKWSFSVFFSLKCFFMLVHYRRQCACANYFSQRESMGWNSNSSKIKSMEMRVPVTPLFYEEKHQSRRNKQNYKKEEIKRMKARPKSALLWLNKIIRLILSKTCNSFLLLLFIHYLLGLLSPFSSQVSSSLSRVREKLDETQEQ